MSPEQAGSSKRVDHRSDIFSLGVILYQCATHELPFKGDSLYKLLGEILHSEPPPVRSIAQNVPSAFEAVIVRAMQKDPAARFQTAAELGAALLPFASPRVRLSYEREFGSAAAAAVSVPPAAPSSRTRFVLFGAVLVLGIGAAVALGFALRDRGTTDSEPALVRPRPLPVAQAKPELTNPAAQIETPPSPLAPAAQLDAGIAHKAQPEAPAPQTTEGSTRARDRTSWSQPAKRKNAHLAGGSVDTSPAASPAAPKPEHPSASGSNKAPADDDLFRDRK
jgi:serine/threonine-protein kinase